MIKFSLEINNQKIEINTTSLEIFKEIKNIEIFFNNLFSSIPEPINSNLENLNNSEENLNNNSVNQNNFSDVVNKKTKNIKRAFPGKICIQCGSTFCGSHNRQLYCNLCQLKKNPKKNSLNKKRNYRDSG